MATGFGVDKRLYKYDLPRSTLLFLRRLSTIQHEKSGECHIITEVLQLLLDNVIINRMIIIIIAVLTAHQG